MNDYEGLLRRLKIACISVALLFSTCANGPLTYTVHLPIIISSYRESDPRYALQAGWGMDCCQNFEEEIGLAFHQGGNAHKLDPWNEVQFTQEIGWFNWFNSNYPDLPIPACTYDKHHGVLVDPRGCRAWASANPGMTWVIGNEPDLEFSGGGERHVAE